MPPRGKSLMSVAQAREKEGFSLSRLWKKYKREQRQKPAEANRAPQQQSRSHLDPNASEFVAAVARPTSPVVPVDGVDGDGGFEAAAEARGHRARKPITLTVTVTVTLTLTLILTLTLSQFPIPNSYSYAYP